MDLRALEIQGFKSFPDKLRLTFEERYCAIVGPNGSGKSNIADAITWVLGEQRTKTLRGAKMEDVIFGGTAQRGPAGFAQVSLVLGNEDRSLAWDADEVMITRRYYRSGDSEYYINRKLVRLKDVNTLLMDTGLGRDGYSLVGQGRVDEVLAAKSTDRREIFEEAAGISKYRYQREETLRKLERTEQDMLRLWDKLGELNLQLEPLRKQAETAKKYLLLRDELRGLEISLWMDALDRLADQTRILTQEYETAEERLRTQKEELEKLYRTSEDCSEGIRAADEKAEQLRTEIGQLETQASELSHEADLLDAEERSNQAAIRRLDEENARQQERITDLTARLAERQERLNALASERDALEQEKQRLFRSSSETSREAERSEKDLEALTAKAAEEENAAAAEAARLETIEVSAAAQTESLRETQEERDRLQLRLEEERNALKRTEEQLLKKREAAVEAENQCKGHRMLADTRRERLRTQEERLRKLRMDEESTRSRVSLLTDMEKEYEGFSRAVRVVMREKGRGTLRGIHSTVAGLIHTEDRYTVALETALGNSLQSIVVDREEDGKAAISLLKRQDAGRATFLPLTAIRGSELRERELDRIPGFEGIASQLAECDEHYGEILRNLLGRTVVAEDLDAAIAISRRYSARFRIVTLDGQLVNAGGSMTGGSAARNVGILSRANELQRLRVRLKEIAAEAKEAESALHSGEKELANVEYAAETAGIQLREIQDQVLKLEAEQKQRLLLKEAVEASLQSAENGMSRSKEESARLEKAAEEAGRRQKEHRSEADRLRQLAESQSQDRASIENKLRELGEAAGRLREREAALDTERDALEKGIEEWKGLLQGYSAETTDRDDSRRSYERKNEELQKKSADYRAEAEQRKAEADGRRPALENAMQERQRCEANRGKADREAQERNRSINELERSCAEMGQRKAAADMEERQLLDKLWDGYGLSRSAAQSQRMTLDSSSRAQKRAGQLRREMTALGSPNLAAIEDFDRVNERYTYLDTQKNDLEKAKRELEEVLQTVTEEMKRIFADEFKAVAESFSQTFKELFGGGRGELVLEDPADILNCGIEIRVQPPGKSLRTLTLLSGGERAFVAIALYFAMLKVRPAPFCVLDEIESALDETNVGRFARYTRSMSSNTQFLVITHRRGSMEEADMLYGVTMQKGISQVLRVDLKEAVRNTEA